MEICIQTRFDSEGVDWYWAWFSSDPDTQVEGPTRTDAVMRLLRLHGSKHGVKFIHLKAEERSSTAGR